MQWRSVSLIFCLNSFIVEIVGQIPKKCKKLSPCVCEDEYGRIVDLTPLARKDGLPMYKDYVPTLNELPSFSFNPCYWFDEGTNTQSSCSKVAACMRLNGTDNYIDIGTQASAYFSHFDNGNLSLEFHSRDHKYGTTVSLYCDEGIDNILRVVGDMGGNMFWLQLQSKHCCPKMPSTADTVLRFGPAQNQLPVPKKILTTHKEQCLICARSLDVILFVVLALSIFTLAAVIFVYVVRRQKIRNIIYRPVDNPDDMVHFDATNQVII